MNETNSNKKVTWIVVVLVGLLGVFFMLHGRGEVIASDLVMEGDYTIDKKTILKDGATLTVHGNFVLNDYLICDGGPVKLILHGATTINGSVRCEDGEGDHDVMIVASGGLTIAKTADIYADGNIQIVSSEDALLTTKEAIDQKFDEIGRDEGAGQRVGPLMSDGDSSAAAAFKGAYEVFPVKKGFSFANIFTTPVAHAQAPAPVVIAGRMAVGTPPPGIKRLVIFAFPDAEEIQIADFELTGPDVRKGTDDNGANCIAKGGDGEDAFRFNAVAPNLTVNNFTLNLGNGGSGGDAETPKDCTPGRAEGGKGGSSGNFKMTGGQSFKITGAFAVNPGRGGAGGGALAKGKDGGKSEDGGDATAIGGRGADNKKNLKVAGTVDGTASVTIGDLMGGFGGGATAEPGNGGHGEGCAAAGGKGGNGVATSGDGGDAKLTLGGGAGRADLASDIGGTGGVVMSNGGNGGNGGSCDATGAGGNGGKGGDANSKEGKGGMGSSGRASDGANLDETGGNGGNGGDGCPEGKGAKGGNGDPVGTDGTDGKNVCVEEKKKETFVDPGKKTIKAIEYGGKYLPVDQLIIEDEEGCGADHWHAAMGVVKATDGSQVSDPGPQCGYGKVSEKPARDVEVKE